MGITFVMGLYKIALVQGILKSGNKSYRLALEVLSITRARDVARSKDLHCSILCILAGAISLDVKAFTKVGLRNLTSIDSFDVGNVEQKQKILVSNF